MPINANSSPGRISVTDTRRQVLRLAVSSALAAAISAGVWAQAFPPVAPLSSAIVGDGLVLNSVVVNDNSGRAVSVAGEINNDDFDDLPSGLKTADPKGFASAGAEDCLFADGFEPDGNGCPTLVIPPATSWQWQLSGAIDTSVDVQMYDIDLEDAPQASITELQAAGRIVICYFSAGSWESFRSDSADFPESVKGDPLDPPFADERWLDIRRIDLLGPIMAARLDRAAAKGCDGVEPDNVDGYTNTSGFPLTFADQIAYNTWLANQAHARGLSVGLKNDLDQITELLPLFDWALNEQCFEFDECDLLLPFIKAGKAVFGVEYNLETTAFCAQANAMNFDWLKKNIDLDAFRVSCR